MTAFNKVDKPLTKLSSSLKISDLHKNQTKILTTKVKFWRSENDYLCVSSPFFAAKGRVLGKNSSILSHTVKEIWRGHSYQLTTVRSRHHGLTVVLAGTKFFAFLLLHWHKILGASMGGQYILKWGSNARSKWSKFLQISSNNHTKHKTRIKV